jgi:uncharacterized protein (UPF0179 family)
MTCRTCGRKPAEEGKQECFRCRVSTVGFRFEGGGGYGRTAFHDRTISERRAEILGDKVVGVDVEPVSTFGR